MSLEKISIHMQQTQARDLFSFLESLWTLRVKTEVDRIFALSQQQRPRKSAKEDPRAWWRHGIRSIIRINNTRNGVTRQPMTWKSVRRHMRDRKRYVELYNRSRREVDWLPPLEDEETLELEHLEDRLNVEAIIVFRSLADSELKFHQFQKTTQEMSMQRQRDLAHSSAAAQTGWWGYATSFIPGTRSSSSTLSSEQVSALLTLTDEQRRDLYASIDFEEAMKKVTLPEDFVQLRVEVVLKEMNVKLLHGTCSLLSATCGGMFTLNQRQSSSVSSVAVKTLQVQDATVGSNFPLVINYVLDRVSRLGD